MSSTSVADDNVNDVRACSGVLTLGALYLGEGLLENIWKVRFLPLSSDFGHPKVGRKHSNLNGCEIISLSYFDIITFSINDDFVHEFNIVDRLSFRILR